MRNVVIGLILLCALGGTAAFAAPTCSAGTLATYTQGGFTCTEDNGVLTFKNFVYTPPMGGLNASQITVNPLDAPGQVGFFLSSGNLNFTAGVYVFSYFIDPPPIIHGEQIDLDPMASVMLQVDLCTTQFSPNCGGMSLWTLTADNVNPAISLMASLE